MFIKQSFKIKFIKEKPKTFHLTTELRKDDEKNLYFQCKTGPEAQLHRACTALWELCYMLYAQYFSLTLTLQISKD